MRYSKLSTIRHGILIGFKECLTNLNALILKEGCPQKDCCFDPDVIVLDMDCVESKVARSENRTNNKSMDSMLMTKDPDGKDIAVFIEFRFNYKSMKNLRAKALRDKKKFSCKHLRQSGINEIHDNYFYVFDPNLKEQARRYFRSLYPSMPNNFKPITIRDLKDRFFQ